MGAKAFFWKGLKVLGTLMSWKPYGIPLSPAEKQGTSREMGELSVRSRNYLYDIKVKTNLSPRTTLDLGNDLTIGPQGVMNLTFLQWQATAIGLSSTLGPLSWCEDVDEKLDVSGVVAPGAYPGVGTVSYAGAGFTPLAGMYVLLRDPESGEGFVTFVTGVGGGAITCVLDNAIDTDWDIVLIRFYYPNTAFRQVDGYETATQVDDKWIPDLTTSFKSKSHPVYPTDYLIDLG